MLVNKLKIFFPLATVGLVCLGFVSNVTAD